MGDVKKKVIFDLDGVIIKNIEKICRVYDIDFRKIKNYSIRKCSELTDKEIELIISKFADAEMFDELYDGAEKLKYVNERHDLHINSLSCSAEVAEFKRKLLKSLIPDIQDDGMVLSVIDDHLSKELDECDIVVEDCFENLMKNYTKFSKAYLINRPYNIDICLDGLDKIHRCESLDSCIDRLLTED